MKRSIWLTLILVVSWPQLQAQSVKVLYDVFRKNKPMHVQSNGNNTGTAYIKSSVIGEVEPRPTAHRQLLYYNGISLYESFMTQEEAKIKEQQDALYKRPEFGTTVYKNFKDKQILTEEKVVGKKYLVAEPFRTYKWKLVDEEKKIAGYRCKKAVEEESKITAWYTTEVGIEDGPGFYNGLPGLILEIENESETITATEVEDDYYLTKKLTAPSSGEKMSRSGFDKFKKNKMNELGIIDEYTGARLKVNEGNAVQEVDLNSVLPRDSTKNENKDSRRRTSTIKTR